MEENKKITPKIETLSGDMVKVLEHPEEGLIKKLIQEEEVHEEEKNNFSPESTKNKILVSISFLLLGIGTAALVLFVLNKDALVLEVAPQFTPLIYTDETTFLPIDELGKEDIAAELYAKTSTTTVKENGVEGIYVSIENKIMGLREFMARIESTLALDKNMFIQDNFLLGVANRETTDLFILMKIRSHTDVFETMRGWEAKMFSDLHDFFGYPLNSETSYLLTKDFEDGIMQNQNARILYDREGNIVLAYVYADNTSLVVTNSESALRLVIERLATGKIKK